MNLKELVEAVSTRGDAELRASWSSLSPIEKAASFKLMRRERALKFFTRLPFDEQYQMICAAPHGTIAPLLEDRGPAIETLFYHLSVKDVAAMVDHAVKHAPLPSPLPMNGEREPSHEPLSPFTGRGIRQNNPSPRLRGEGTVKTTPLPVYGERSPEGRPALSEVEGVRG